MTELDKSTRRILITGIFLNIAMTCMHFSVGIWYVGILHLAFLAVTAWMLKDHEAKTKTTDSANDPSSN